MKTKQNIYDDPQPVPVDTEPNPTTQPIEDMPERPIKK